MDYIIFSPPQNRRSCFPSPAAGEVHTCRCARTSAPPPADDPDRTDANISFTRFNPADFGAKRRESVFGHTRELFGSLFLDWRRGMAGGGTQQSLRKALGAIKDSTKVGLAKVNSDYKELDVAIVKATNHVQRPSKEKYIQNIFSAISAARPRADVAYCIHALARRLAKTHNWAVALKTLIVIHRALREVDATFREELVNYSGGRSPMLNLAHFKDDSSPHAWDYSSWIRQYALFLEERLECFFVLKYDVETDYPSTAKGLAFPIKSMAARSAMSSADNTVTDGTPLTMRFFSLCVDVLSISATSAPSDSLFQEFSEVVIENFLIYDLQLENLITKMMVFLEDSWAVPMLKRTKDLGTMELLEQLSALQLLLFRLLACEVAGESVKIYNAICDGTINMIDKFFEMRRDDAVKALEIYRKAGKQAKQLSSFYELCKSLGLGRGERFPKIEQPPESFIEAMEEYVLNAPLGLIRKDQEVCHALWSISFNKDIDKTTVL
ncbi:hypothetical protein ACLOJK_027696 [Asimina triloba]